MDATDYYSLLEVAPKAQTAAIRLAYHALARLHHPDHIGGSNAAMASLNEAWAVLRNDSDRVTYDREHGFAVAPAEPATGQASAEPAPPSTTTSGRDVLDFGRYAGWSLKDLVRRDPDYLLWLKRTSIGRRYGATIDALLQQVPTPLAGAKRSGWARGH